MNTFMEKKETVERKWYVIDAEGVALGRLASKAAVVLKGKHKATYTPHIDGGDYVIVVNADKIAVTGNKLKDKKYYRHSQYAGGLKVRTLEEQMAKKPESIVEMAVRGMLPKGPQGDNMYRRLYVYVGSEHEQQAQKPEAFPLEVK
jgi:large subunit ribosomal protein L13